jgi:hypothetical protein
MPHRKGQTPSLPQTITGCLTLSSAMLPYGWRRTQPVFRVGTLSRAHACASFRWRFAETKSLLYPVLQNYFVNPQTFQVHAFIRGKTQRTVNVISPQTGFRFLIMNWLTSTSARKWARPPSSSRPPHSCCYSTRATSLLNLL